MFAVFAQIALFALAHASQLAAAASIGKTLLPGAIQLGKTLAPVVHDWVVQNALPGASPAGVIDGWLQSIGGSPMTAEQKASLNADWAKAMNRQSAAESPGWNPENSSFAS